MSFFFSSVTENTAIAVKKELMECDFDKSFFFKEIISEWCDCICFNKHFLGIMNGDQWLEHILLYSYI